MNKVLYWKRLSSLRLLHTSSAPCRVIDEGERLIKAEARKRGIAKSEVSGLFSQSLEDGGRYQSTLGSYGDEVETEARQSMRIKDLALRKIMEKSYKDVYKIKPGEKYLLAKDPFFKTNPDSKDRNHPHHQPTRQRYKNYDKTLGKAVHEDVLDTDNPFSMVNLQPSKFSEANVGNKKQTYDPAPEEVYYKQKNIRYTERQLLEDYARSEYQTSNIDLEKLGQQLAPEENSEQNHRKTAPKYDGNDVYKKSPSEGDKKVLPFDFSAYDGPNLLLWSMKRQLVHLHDQDPEYWEPELLSSVFPMAPKDIKSLLKSRWSPPTESHRKLHDEKAMQNWRQLGGGEIASEAMLRRLLSLPAQTEDSSSLPVSAEGQASVDTLLKGITFDDDEKVRPVKAKAMKRPRHGYFAEILQNYEAQCRHQSQHQDSRLHQSQDGNHEGSLEADQSEMGDGDQLYRGEENGHHQRRKLSGRDGKHRMKYGRAHFDENRSDNRHENRSDDRHRTKYDSSHYGDDAPRPRSKLITHEEEMRALQERSKGSATQSFKGSLSQSKDSLPQFKGSLPQRASHYPANSNGTEPASERLHDCDDSDFTYSNSQRNSSRRSDVRFALSLAENVNYDEGSRPQQYNKRPNKNVNKNKHKPMNENMTYDKFKELMDEREKSK